jgi:small subunit ribosomal protein S16
MVIIRLARAGTHKRPFYYLVATDRRNKRDGRYIERLGFYNPLAQGASARLSFAKDRVDYWLSVGAQCTDRVQSLLKQENAAAA